MALRLSEGLGLTRCGQFDDERGMVGYSRRVLSACQKYTVDLNHIAGRGDLEPGREDCVIYARARGVAPFTVCVWNLPPFRAQRGEVLVSHPFGSSRISVEIARKDDVSIFSCTNDRCELNPILSEFC